jgi:carboxylate-amine ligase
VADTAALAALVQCIAKLEVEHGYASTRALEVPEALDENRFLAARDGMGAELIDVELERRVPAREVALRLVEACAPHAAALGCDGELDRVVTMAEQTGADRQLELARGPERLDGLVSALADSYL